MKQIKFILLFILAVVSAVSVYDNGKLRKSNKVLCSNIEVLYDSVAHYKVADSLNAAKVAELQFSEKELLRLYCEDKILIEQLTKKAKLQTVEKIETVTHDTITVELRDTLLVDSVKHFKHNSKWTDIEGCITQDSLSINIANREALLITESLEKKKFWFMKLPIWLFGYKNKRLDVVSRNPNTQIQSVEYINVR